MLFSHTISGEWDGDVAHIKQVYTSGNILCGLGNGAVCIACTGGTTIDYNSTVMQTLFAHLQVGLQSQKYLDIWI